MKPLRHGVTLAASGGTTIGAKFRWRRCSVGSGLTCANPLIFLAMGVAWQITPAHAERVGAMQDRAPRQAGVLHAHKTRSHRARARAKALRARESAGQMRYLACH